MDNTTKSTHKIIRIEPDAKDMLAEMSERERRQPVFQLSIIVREFYARWKEEQHNG